MGLGLHVLDQMPPNKPTTKKMSFSLRTTNMHDGQGRHIDEKVGYRREEYEI